MLSALTIFVSIKRGSVFRNPVIQLAGNTSRHLGVGEFTIADTVNFHPIAGVEHECFSAAGFPQQLLSLQTSAEPLPRFYIRGVMTEANAKNFHNRSMQLRAEGDSPQQSQGGGEPADAQRGHAPRSNPAQMPAV